MSYWKITITPKQIVRLNLKMIKSGAFNKNGIKDYNTGFGVRWVMDEGASVL